MSARKVEAEVTRAEIRKLLSVQRTLLEDAERRIASGAPGTLVANSLRSLACNAADLRELGGDLRGLESDWGVA